VGYGVELNAAIHSDPKETVGVVFNYSRKQAFTDLVSVHRTINKSINPDRTDSDLY
jgi:hypothetical protein